MSERECHLNGYFVGVERIHLEIHWEGQIHSRLLMKAEALSVPGMVPALPWPPFRIKACHGKPETAYTIRMLECGNDIVVVVRRYLVEEERIVDVVNDDRKGWPEIQIFPDRCSTFA